MNYAKKLMLFLTMALLVIAIMRKRPQRKNHT